MGAATRDHQVGQGAESDHDHAEVVTETNERRIRFVLIFTAGYALGV